MHFGTVKELALCAGRMNGLTDWKSTKQKPKDSIWLKWAGDGVGHPLKWISETLWLGTFYALGPFIKGLPTRD